MNAKNRVVKVIVTISALFILIWGGMFVTDFIRCNSFKTPIFVSTSDNIADDGVSGTYKGLGYTVNVRKHVSAEYGIVLESVEMSVFGKVVSASIQ